MGKPCKTRRRCISGVGRCMMMQALLWWLVMFEDSKTNSRVVQVGIDHESSQAEILSTIDDYHC